jgi:hypothetical protein
MNDEVLLLSSEEASWVTGSAFEIIMEVYNGIH